MARVSSRLSSVVMGPPDGSAPAHVRGMIHRSRSCNVAVAIPLARARTDVWSLGCVQGTRYEPTVVQVRVATGIKRFGIHTHSVERLGIVSENHSLEVQRGVR